MILGSVASEAKAASVLYRKFVEDRLGAEYESPLLGAVAGTILGGRGFVDQIKLAHVQDRDLVQDLPAVRKLTARPLVEKIMAVAAEELRGKDQEARRIGLHLCHVLSGLSLRQLGEVFGVGPTALCEASRRTKRRIATNPELRETVARIRERVKA
ncbi:MAG: hypothetical protein A2005_01050 [Desulfuromonadales bacterium GWC2_61_20]|nr:MAG: hypothetical protein A2005_01050 [Desulfuromonadales bacterium GWC2_61_20]HAD03140.1 hypothetical protein [Desulfuromonas sp.]